MKFAKKLISVLVVAVLALTLVSGIHLFESKASKNSVQPALVEDAVAETLIPKETSADINCYVFGDSLCDKKGQPVTFYQFDDERNIVDPAGTIVVAAENTIHFSYVTKVTYDKSLLRQTLNTAKMADGSVAIVPTKFRIKLSIEPADAVNKELVIESLDAEALYFPYKDNASVLSAPAMNSGKQSSISVIANEQGDVDITLVGAYQGHMSVTIKNVMGEIIQTLDVVLTADIPEGQTVAPIGTISQNEESSENTSKNSNNQSSGQNNNSNTNNSSDNNSATSGNNSSGGSGSSTAHQHVYRTQVMEATAQTQGYTLHVCEICGFSYRDAFTPILTHTHNWRAVNTVPATYTAQGYTIYQCTECLQQETRDYTPVLICQHVVCSRVDVPATCTTGGYTVHNCMVCGNYSYTDNEVPALGHAMDEGTVTQPADCEHDGVMSYHCTREGCTEHYEKAIPAMGHEWDDGYITTPATCAAEGVKTFTCGTCGATRTEPVPMVAHQWDDGHVTDDPTCTEAGTKTFTCAGCGATHSESVDPLGHSWDDGAVTTPPSCSQMGVMTYTCTVCGDTRTEDIDTIAHTMTTEVVPPTYASQGYTRHYCTVCGYEGEHTDFTEPLEHVHQYESEVVDPTCQAGGYTQHTCTLCGHSYQDNETPAGGHSYVITQVEATDTTKGCLQHTCSVCGDTYFSHYTTERHLPSYMEEGQTVDIDAVVAIGKQWLEDNGEVVSDIATSIFPGISFPGNVTFETAIEYIQIVCMNTVCYARSQCAENPGYTPVFWCGYEPQGSGFGVYCYYALIPVD